MKVHTNPNGTKVSVPNSADIHPSVNIREGVVIGKNVTIHAGVTIYRGASIAPGASIRAIVVIAALALFFASCTGENPRDAHFQIYGCSPSNLQPDGRCGLSLK